MHMHTTTVKPSCQHVNLISYVAPAAYGNWEDCILCVCVCVLIPKGGFYIQYSFNNCTSINVFVLHFFIFSFLCTSLTQQRTFIMFYFILLLRLNSSAKHKKAHIL